MTDTFNPLDHAQQLKEAGDQFDERRMAIESKLDTLQWMVILNLIMSLGILYRLIFFPTPSSGIMGFC